MLSTSLRVKLSDWVPCAHASEHTLTAMTTAKRNVDLTRYEAHDDEQMLCMYVQQLLLPADMFASVQQTQQHMTGMNDKICLSHCNQSHRSFFSFQMFSPIA